MPTGLPLAERIAEHVRVLSDEIGARPAGSRAERRAADYVREQLVGAGIAEVEDQTFSAPASLGMSVLPYLAGAALAVPLAWLGRFGKLLGGTLLLGGIINVREFLLGKAPLYAPLVNIGVSRNVMARLPARETADQTVYLIAHLDTNKQRFMAPQFIPSLTRPFNTGMLAAGAIGGISLLIDGLAGRRKSSTFQLVVGGLAAGGLAALVYDETQPHIDGAISNASGVAAVLELARVIAAEPLTRTDVVVVFTGAAETLNTGLEAYLTQYAPSVERSWFIVVASVGAGEIAYAMQEGLSAFSDYRPGPRLTAAAARTASARPELRVGGAAMTLLSETAALRRRGYEAITLVGHDGAGGIPHWHRQTDTFAAAQPDTIRRAADYAIALLAELDKPRPA